MNAFFIILRILTGLSSLGALILWSLVVFLRDTASTAKQGLHVFAYVTKLFASAFTEGTAPKEADWQMGPWQIMLGVLSIAMIVSVFTPGTRWFLHCVGVLAAFVMIGYTRMIFIGPSLEIVCIPFLLLWFGYYAMCIFWRNAPLAA